MTSSGLLHAWDLATCEKKCACSKLVPKPADYKLCTHGLVCVKEGQKSSVRLCLCIFAYVCVQEGQKSSVRMCLCMCMYAYVCVKEGQKSLVRMLS